MPGGRRRAALLCYPPPIVLAFVPILVEDASNRAVSAARPASSSTPLRAAALLSALGGGDVGVAGVESLDEAVEAEPAEVVERCFATLKNWSGLATRSEKSKILGYRGGVVLASILI